MSQLRTSTQERVLVGRLWVAEDGRAEAESLAMAQRQADREGAQEQASGARQRSGELVAQVREATGKVATLVQLPPADFASSGPYRDPFEQLAQSAIVVSRALSRMGDAVSDLEQHRRDQRGKGELLLGIAVIVLIALLLISSILIAQAL